MPRRGVVPKFSDLEVIALALTAETESIDIESRLLSMQKSHRELMPNLISRRQYNDRRKYTAGLCEDIRKRVAARLGSGGLSHDTSCIIRNDQIVRRTDHLFWHIWERINKYEYRKPERLDIVRIDGEILDEAYKFNRDKIPLHLHAEIKIEPWKIHKIIENLSWPSHPSAPSYPPEEPEVFFYHSDHLGGASWITDGDGNPVQHLQYLPFGQPFVDQHPAGYQERFTFTGKEKDEETGYGYFGARYMDHELTTMWLSVDPLADKYPNISPYNYCMWNPVRVIDPNGMDTIVFDGDGNFSNRIKADGNHVGRLLDKNGNKRFDFEFVCQQDADRCCSPGSQEEYDIYDRDKLSHAMDCPAEEKVPIYRIELVWQKEIISQLKESGACDKSFLPRIGYALRESDGGHLDFDNVNRHNGVWNDQTLYIPMVPGKKYAHNVSNMGNFLWGAAMHKMGISYKDIILGSNLHALIKHHEFDSRDDQLSIGLGYLYSMKTARSR